MLKTTVTFTITSLLISSIASAAPAAAPAAAPQTQTTTTTTLVAQPAQADKPVTTTTTTTTAPAAGGHQWDWVAGGVEKGRFNLRIEVPVYYYPAPTLGLSYGVSDMVEIGAQIALFQPDYTSSVTGTNPVSIGSVPGFYGQLPIRFGLLNNGTHSFGLKVSPGVALYDFGSVFRMTTLLLHVGLNYGYWVIAKTLLLGVGADAHMMMPLYPLVQFRAPVLFGINGEYHFNEHYGLFADLKVGFMMDSHQVFAWSQRLAFGFVAHF